MLEGDIRDREFINNIVAAGRFDTIVHLAARAGVRPSVQNPGLYIETNITGTATGGFGAAGVGFVPADLLRKAGNA